MEKLVHDEECEEERRQLRQDVDSGRQGFPMRHSILNRPAGPSLDVLAPLVQAAVAYMNVWGLDRFCLGLIRASWVSDRVLVGSMQGAHLLNHDLFSLARDYSPTSIKQHEGRKRLHTHEGPTYHGFWNPPCLVPESQTVGSLRLRGLWDPYNILVNLPLNMAKAKSTPRCELSLRQSLK